MVLLSRLSSLQEEETMAAMDVNLFDSGRDQSVSQVFILHHSGCNTWT